MVEYLKIPAKRIKCLLADNSKIVKRIEKETNTKVKIDSELNEVVISETDESDPFLLWKARDVIKAIGRGFSPKKAFRILEENADLKIINLKDYLGKSKSTQVRIKGRIIGKEGKSKKKIQDLTNTDIVIHGHTVAIIGFPVGLEIAMRAIEKLINGAMHGAVFKSMEKELKDKAKEL
ncbi:MAG: KH domain-containing protein [Candidatus Undinarchaeales archaeon]